MKTAAFRCCCWLFRLVRLCGLFLLGRMQFREWSLSVSGGGDRRTWWFMVVDCGVKEMSDLERKRIWGCLRYRNECFKIIFFMEIKC